MSKLSYKPDILRDGQEIAQFKMSKSKLIKEFVI